GTIDLMTPSSFGFGASISFAPGQGPDRIVRLDGTLHYEPGELGVDADMFIAGAKVSTSTGRWDFHQGDISLDSRGAFFGIPFPSTSAVIDGRTCTFAGGSRADFFGLTSVDLIVGLRLAPEQCGNGPVPSGTRSEVVNIIAACKNVPGGTLLAGCGTGNAHI
ncbi:hypothetical protein, partial [Sporosarcina luteola]|uniref:hypothetical protein n=1 Tax=Sporosarcina luteola TaxID=582850 RepID=UPI00203C5C9C